MMAKGCGCGMGAVRKPAKRKTKAGKRSTCRYVITVAGFGAGPRQYATSHDIAVRKAKLASKNGETAVVERKCGRRPAEYVKTCEWGKCWRG